MTPLPHPISAFLAAVNAREADDLTSVLDSDITYHVIVPHPPVRGRDAVVETMRRVLSEAERVDWEVVSWGQSDGLVFVERIDRFWYGGREAAIECLGVFTIAGGLITEIRDYADLGTWRTRKAAATSG